MDSLNNNSHAQPVNSSDLIPNDKELKRNIFDEPDQQVHYQAGDFNPNSISNNIAPPAVPLDLEHQQQQQQPFAQSQDDTQIQMQNIQLEQLQQQQQQPQINYEQPYQHNTVVFIEKETQNKIVYNGKPFPGVLACVCLFINLFIPGIGTMIGTIGMNDRNVKLTYICSGCCQFVTSFCIVGWCFALMNSILYLQASASSEPFETFIALKGKNKKIEVGIVNQNGEIVPISANNNNNSNAPLNNQDQPYNNVNINVDMGNNAIQQ